MATDIIVEPTADQQKVSLYNSASMMRSRSFSLPAGAKVGVAALRLAAGFSQANLAALETAIKNLPGVAGAEILFYQELPGSLPANHELRGWVTTHVRIEPSGS